MTAMARSFVPLGVLLLALTPLPGAAQLLRQSELTPGDADPSFRLTLDHLAEESRWLGLPPGDVTWAPDGSVVFFRWRPDPAPGQLSEDDPWYAVSAAGDAVREVGAEEAARIPADDRTWSGDRRTWAWSRGGTLYVWRADQGGEGVADARPVFTSEGNLSNVHVAPDGSRVFFSTRGGGFFGGSGSADLWAWDAATGAVRQLATPREVPEDPKTDAAKWLKGQQLELLEVIAERRREREATDSIRRTAPIPRPQPIPVEKDTRIRELRLSPDGTFLTFQSVKEPQGEPRTQFMDFVSESGYATARNARSKVGEPQSTFRMGIVRVDPAVHPDSVEVAWVEDGIERETIIHGPYWNAEGDRAAVQMLSLDHKDRWIAVLDTDSATLRVLDHQHEDAWIGGPLVDGRWSSGFWQWLPGGRELAFASTASGWAHLYLVNVDDGAVRQLTRGDFEVRAAELSGDGQTWYLTTSMEHPGEEHLYHLPARGGELSRVTRGEGIHRVAVSPDGRRLATLFETRSLLPDLYLLTNRPVADDGPDPPGRGTTRITKSGTDAFYRVDWLESEIFSFADPQGLDTWAEVWEPPASPNGAAVVYVHGCGECAQAVTKGWRRGASARLYAKYLHQNGYVAANLDYRGSSGYGHANRTYAYRQMGVSDVDSGLPLLDILVERYGVDPDRIGVYGGSYGGFFTLMALMRHPDRWAAGVALYPVADWAHYNHGYTSRILNGSPYEDEEAYRVSSPIYYAENLGTGLQIQHGLVDDNVQVQDVFRLSQRLIELKKDFDLVVYPVEDHGWDEVSTKRDSYRRMTDWFDRWLLGRVRTGEGVTDAAAAGAARVGQRPDRGPSEAPIEGEGPRARRP